MQNSAPGRPRGRPSRGEEAARAPFCIFRTEIAGAGPEGPGNRTGERMASVVENPNPVVHSRTFRVAPEMIDLNHHLNNVWPVQWIQDISVEHSDLAGGTALMRELGGAWMIHVQHVEYRNQAFLGEEIKGSTWVAAYGRLTCVRKCRFERVSDGKTIFESETEWVLVDVKRGRPMAIPEEMKALYRAPSEAPASGSPSP